MSASVRAYPEYRDPKIQWLGDLPSHWEVLPHRALFQEIKTRGYQDLQLLSVTIDRGVIRQSDLLSESIKKDSSNEDKSNYKLVTIGDIAYNKMRAWQGAIGWSRFRGIVSPAYIVVRLRTTTNNPKFFHYLFRTPSFATEAQRWSYGISSDQWSLRWEDFKKIYSPVPPPEEQRAIVQFLEHEDRRLAELVTAYRKLVGVSKSVAERKLSLIHEYRTRLGVDLVTGKLDVREAATRLPEEVEEHELTDETERVDEAADEIVDLPTPEESEV